MSRRALSQLGAIAVLVAAGVATTGSSAFACCPAPPAAWWSSDYNGDRYADVIIGEPRRTVAGKSLAGAVRVVYGSANGLASAGSQLITADSLGVPDSSQANALFGQTVVSGNFDRDEWLPMSVTAAMIRGYG